MVSMATVLTCTITLLVSFLLPPAVLLVHAVKNKGSKIISAWLLGAAGFLSPRFSFVCPS